MSKGPLSVPGAKASLLLSTGLSVLGIGGVLNGLGLLTYQPGTHLDGPLGNEATEAVTELMAAWPAMQALAAANLLVSSLLVVASFVLMLRRPSSLWWIRQALIGNVLHAIAAVAIGIAFHREHADTLQRLTEQLPQIQEATPGAPVPEAWAYFAIGDVCRGLFILAAYLAIWRVSRRPDVRKFVGAAR